MEYEVYRFPSDPIQGRLAEHCIQSDVTLQSAHNLIQIINRCSYSSIYLYIRIKVSDLSSQFSSVFVFIAVSNKRFQGSVAAEASCVFCLTTKAGW